MGIYLDYAATTPVDERVAEEMKKYLTIDGNFGNPASRSHQFGWSAEDAVEAARKNVADLINANPKEIIWTSGATESDNLAIKGAAHFNQRRGKHIITAKTEHKAVLDTCRQLEREGFEVTYIDPNPQGIITLDEIKAAVREDTTVVSIMQANNETGTINDIDAIGAFTRENKIIFHVDGAQSAGKMPIDVEASNIDLMSLTAHKIYGPKGIGALYVRRKPRIRLEAQMHGGGHERGFRSGTLPTHQIVGMGEAFRVAKLDLDKDRAHVKTLANRLWDGVKDIPEVYLNGQDANKLDNILNISFSFIEGESLMMSINELAVSSGSACTSASLEPSYVLRALGVADELASSSIRFSFGRMTTEADIDRAIELIRAAVDKLRALSPLWEMHQNGIDLNSVQWSHH
ncbi:IscS subfamily cysteine desulfurase [Ostreibacterium oceani]|uniref:Cysteine desulfurase IscS n=1 Tax=Ostreibacterium oceani TaxID=2654998 RepID=A0A6N7F012_9GAMM|nr:IscS subfamily cysteine desulfurase [Ostreibacterium oceani]MPV85176.1 IscS subfamily cysteine desulfurase [Ostreibacterium oceani]